MYSSDDEANGDGAAKRAKQEATAAAAEPPRRPGAWRHLRPGEAFKVSNLAHGSVDASELALCSALLVWPMFAAAGTSPLHPWPLAGAPTLSRACAASSRRRVRAAPWWSPPRTLNASRWRSSSTTPSSTFT